MKTMYFRLAGKSLVIT